MGWRRRSSIDKQKHQQALVQPHPQPIVKQTVEQTTQTQSQRQMQTLPQKQSGQVPQKQSGQVQAHPHKYGGYHSKLRAIIEKNCNNNTVQTLLAKALYDNLADAPDELSFRKGDIVTVIEQDVDGLIGWWLCLLHGRQGIVPGNRLQVIPPVELDQLERNKTNVQKNRGSYSTDEFSDGTEGYGDQNHNYDVLPAPIKANPGSGTPLQRPLSIKDMFDIPFKSQKSLENDLTKTHGQETSNSSTAVDDKRHDDGVFRAYPVFTARQDSEIDQPTYAEIPDLPSNEIYDVPKVQNTPSQEIYDVPQQKPKKKWTSATEQLNSSISSMKEVYDTPSNRSSVAPPTPQEIYDIPVNTYKPVTKEETNKKFLQNFYNKPQTTTHSLPRGATSQEIYDTPKSSTLPRNASMSGKTVPQEVYDVPSRAKSVPRAPKPAASPKKEVYDVPVFNKSANTEPQEIYDVPVAKRTLPAQEIYDVPSPKTNRKFTPNVSLDTSQEIYDTPKTLNRSLDTSQEIYDTPKTLNRSLDMSQEIYDTPNTLNRSLDTSQEIYNTPKSTMETYKVPVNVPVVSQEVYDVPSNSKHQQLQEIYDVPSSKAFQQEIYDVPANKSLNSSFEQYRVPSSNRLANVGPQDIYDVPASNRMNQEIYDVPGNNTLKRELKAEVQKLEDFRESFIQQQQQGEIYDVPVTHDLNQVMADVTNAYKPHTRNKQNFLTPMNARDDDDYVDYHDIWNDKPPTQLVTEHKQNISQKDAKSLQQNVVEQKKSILDQINFDNVKELPLTTSQALERLGKLHLAVDTCVKTLRAFYIDDWLQIENLKLNIPLIRDFSGKLKTALRLLTEFGLGTLVNSTKHENGEVLMDMLIADVEPLLECYYKVKICLMHLDNTNWLVPDVKNSKTEKFFATLNAIMILSGLIPEQCRAFNIFVQAHVAELFEDDGKHGSMLMSQNFSLQQQPVPQRAPQMTPKQPQKQPQVQQPQVQQPQVTVRQTSQEIRVSSVAKGKLSPMDPKQIREFLEIDTRQPSVGLPNNYPIEKHPDAEMSAATLRRELASRRQQARDAGSAHGSVPRVPPKPALPHQRKSLVSADEPQGATASAVPFERLVTDFIPENGARKKYASDPASSPSHRDANKTMWGGSCPVLLDRNSAHAAVSVRGADSSSSSSSVSVSIPEEEITVKESIAGSPMTKAFPSDSNLLSSGPPTPLHQRSVSLPWGTNKKDILAYDNDNNNRQPGVSSLDHRDIEALEFFCRQVESQVMSLRESMRNLTEAVENRDEPEVFVSHSKFVIVTAHKVVHAGQEIAERLFNAEVKAKIKDSTSHLTMCIRGVVAATKTAALEYPEPSAMMEMISSVLAIGDAVRIIHSECRRALDS